jgi:mono/diheme cytochrome c family protein
MHRRLAIVIACVVVVCAAVVVIRNRTSAAPASSGEGSSLGIQEFSMVEKGRALTVAADCEGCHTVPGNNHPFAGGRPIETPFGTLLGSNITPDWETGIGAWSDDEFDAALRQGKRPDGSLLYPAMPYIYYTKMSREDVRAIRAYLNTLTPVHNDVVSNQLPFPFNVRSAMYVWNALYFRKGEFKPDPHKSSDWNRGAYLIQSLAHCGACHTPKTSLGGDDESRYLQGGDLQGWFASDITNNKTRGLGDWSADDIVSYLKTGHNRMSAATGPMAEEIVLSSSKMPESDLRAIATYLKDQPASESDATRSPLPASDPRMVAGDAIYRDRCSACHGGKGEGVERLFPALAASSNVRSTGAASLIRVILRGTRSVATPAEPTSPAMPSYAWQLDDDQVAAVLTYIRNSWGAAAPPIAAKDVRAARESLASRSD